MVKVQKQIFYKDDILYLDYRGIEFEVKVVEPRPAFGRIDYLVKPVAGKGEQHVNQDSLKKK